MNVYQNFLSLKSYLVILEYVDNLQVHETIKNKIRDTRNRIVIGKVFKKFYIKEIFPLIMSTDNIKLYNTKIEE